VVQSVIAAVLPAAAPLGVAQAAAGGIAGDLPAVPAWDRVSCRDLLELLAFG
jgi:hypothetical protein